MSALPGDSSLSEVYFFSPEENSYHVRHDRKPAEVFKKADMSKYPGYVFHVVRWYFSKNLKQSCPVWGAFKSHDAFLSWHDNSVRTHGKVQGICETIVSAERCLLHADFDIKGLPGPIVGGTKSVEDAFVEKTCSLLTGVAVPPRIKSFVIINVSLTRNCWQRW